VLARLRLPGCSSFVLTHKVMALTGRRFVNSISLQQAAPDLERQPRKKRCTRADVVTADKDATVAAGDAPSAQAMRHIADTMNEKAPEKLTLDQALAFVEGAKFCMVDSILLAMPKYLQPILDHAPLQQVR
jgi:hypothetical protein